MLNAHLPPGTAHLVKVVVKRGQGDVVEVHCLESDASTVTAAISHLRCKGVKCDVYKPQHMRAPTGGLATAAGAGVDDSIRRAGVCKEYYYGARCRHGSNCKFKCYGSTSSQYPAPP